jgi:hypothetical protein
MEKPLVKGRFDCVFLRRRLNPMPGLDLILGFAVALSSEGSRVGEGT